jgi:hypothetical protein
VQLLHREEGSAVVGLADGEHLHDAGVMDLGEAARFVEELLPFLRGGDERRPQHLQRDRTMSPSRVIDDAAASFAEDPGDVEIADPRRHR